MPHAKTAPTMPATSGVTHRSAPSIAKCVRAMIHKPRSTNVIAERKAIADHPLKNISRTYLFCFAAVKRYPGAPVLPCPYSARPVFWCALTCRTLTCRTLACRTLACRTLACRTLACQTRRAHAPVAAPTAGRLRRETGRARRNTGRTGSHRPPRARGDCQPGADHAKHPG